MSRFRHHTASPTPIPFPVPTIKVLICESTPIACELMQSALSRARGLVFSGCVTRCEELLPALQRGVDLVLVSLQMADGPLSGFEAVRITREFDPRMPSILLLDEPTPERVVEAFRVGARGIFNRRDSLPQLLRCLQAVHSGQIWAGSKELGYVLDVLTSQSPLRVVNAKGEHLLSEREQQVVAMIVEGMTNKEISRQLGISEHTVKNHIFRIFDKLGISSRVELLLYVLTPRAEQKNSLLSGSPAPKTANL
jgi:DNA-binding NarL/FixJ family response regulator